jgi:hypothetical protein
MNATNHPKKQLYGFTSASPKTSEVKLYEEKTNQSDAGADPADLALL